MNLFELSFILNTFPTPTVQHFVAACWVCKTGSWACPQQPVHELGSWVLFTD